MKLIDQFPIYEIGGALRQLKAICERDNGEAFDQLYSLWSAGRHLAPLLKGDPIPVNYCHGAASELFGLTQELQKSISPDHGSPPGPLTPMTRHALRRVLEKIEIFEHQLSAELKKTAVYAVPERGIFSTEGLVEKADLHIHESIRGVLPEFSLIEFRSAGRCLAFGLYSASGFHSARSVEGVLKEYYRMFLGEPKKNALTMGEMASHLE